MKITIYMVLLTTIFTSKIVAQTDEHTHSHDHHKNEFGVANAPVYLINEKEYAYGLHIHYVRNIPSSKFGIGIGYERIFNEHKHNTFGFVGTYRPIDGLNLNVAPGLAFEDGNSTTNLALHLEASYEYKIKDFHIGPVLEFAYDLEDIHISLGIHLGFGF